MLGHIKTGIGVKGWCSSSSFFFIFGVEYAVQAFHVVALQGSSTAVLQFLRCVEWRPYFIEEVVEIVFQTIGLARSLRIVVDGIEQTQREH